VVQTRDGWLHMLSRKELSGYVGQFNLQQTEKDYLQHLVLWGMYSYISKNLIFKGGTALQKVYGLDRFSEDLDFTLNLPLNHGIDTEKSVREKIERGLKLVNSFYTLSYEKIKKNNSVNYKLKIRGPLYEKLQSIETIKIETGKRESVLLPTKVVPIIPVYRDLSVYLPIVMNINEMLAEKVRAILTRKQPRDLYDLYFILHKSGEILKSIIAKKLEPYSLEFSIKTFLERIDELKPLWYELAYLLKQVPEFDDVTEYVKNKFIASKKH